MRKKSYISDTIMREYYRRQRYKMRDSFVKKYCKTCVHKGSSLCDIRYTLNDDWRCVNYEIKEWEKVCRMWKANISYSRLGV